MEKTQSLTDNSDYERIKRTINESLKYSQTLADRKINKLNPQKADEDLENIPIVCSFADMEFKFSPTILTHFKNSLEGNDTHFGYPWATSEFKQVLKSWVQARYYENVSMDWYVPSSNMLSLYHATLHTLTQENDQVLILTPTYYRFMYTLLESNRKIIEHEFSFRSTKEGKEIYIDFERLAEVFEKNDIKLMVFINPANPSGRIFSKEELTQLKGLLVKHKCLIFSDEIYSDTVVEVEKFTSLLSISELHPFLIWGCSFGKAFNCSGNSFAYSMVPSEKLRKTLSGRMDHSASFPAELSTRLLQSCYTVGQEWRLTTAAYIRHNYEYVVRECRERIPKLEFLTLDTTYLSVGDFSKFGWKYSQLKERLSSQNIFPTYFDSCYLNRDKESISLVRFNLAMNFQVIQELVNRLQKALKD